MESSTVPASTESTGSATIADMMALAAERYGDRPAVKYKRDGDVARRVVRRGRRDRLGDRARADRPRPGARRPRRAAVHDPRPSGPTRTSRSRAPAASSCRSTPPTRPTECAWVAGNSESRFVVCEDAEQVAKIAEVRGELPALEAVDRDRRRAATSATRSRSTTCASAAAAATPPRSPSAPRRSSPRTRTPSSTPRAPPARRRAACSRTATTARCSTRASRSARSRRARSSTSTCRSRTPTRC